MNLEMKLKSAFEEISEIGVIWVLDEAANLGFVAGNSKWVNLGQGEPEIGKLEGGAERIDRFNIEPNDDRYGPTNGIELLRETIADYYNRLYRKDKISKYTSNNVSIAMGGRMALNRIFTVLGTIRLGYKTPEYPAYQEMLNYQLNKITPICIPTIKENNYSIPSNEFADTIKKYNIMLSELSKNNMSCSTDASSTFYFWADISKLPSRLNNSIFFFNEALKLKVITVPGFIFDIHPGKEKTNTNFNQYVRFSFGPDEESLKVGLNRITELIKSFSKHDS